MAPAAVYALFYGDTDDPAGWLRGGEALPTPPRLPAEQTLQIEQTSDPQ
jgi:hypothetical protein